MKKFAALMVLLACLLPCQAAGSEELSLPAKGAVLIDGDSGRVLFAQNADTPYPMASTTKIMTCLIAVETCSPEETVTAGPNAEGVPGTSIYLTEGEQLTMRDMLYGLMLRSGNDAAVAIAEHIAGSVDAFSQMMNERARELGADATYKNPHGLDAEGHAASARALALIAREGLQNEWFRETVSTQRITIPWSTSEYNRLLVNKNKLLSSYEGALGVKTGFTSKAGRCLVFAAERDGLTLIGAVLNDYTWFDDARTLLDWGFENYTLLTAASAGKTMAALPITGGAEKSVDIVAAEALTSAARAGEAHEIVLDLPAALHAPLESGQAVGTATLLIADEPVAEIELLCAGTVEEGGFWNMLKKAFGLWSVAG